MAAKKQAEAKTKADAEAADAVKRQAGAKAKADAQAAAAEEAQKKKETEMARHRSREAEEAKRKAEKARTKSEQDQREAALCKLAEMGFTNTSRNTMLLEQLHNDVAAVVNQLGQDLPADQGLKDRGRDQGGAAGDAGCGAGKGDQLEESRSFIDTSRVLGSGSFADVMSGTYQFPGRQQTTQVAFKIFRGGKGLSLSIRQKIKEEVEIGMKLNHRNVARLYGVLTHTEYGPSLVVELCPGGSLRMVLDRAHDSDCDILWNTRIRWLKEIASGMAHLHSLLPTSIIHRDLKAANVLLSLAHLDQAIAKVCDFGVAKTLVTLKSTLSAGGGTGTLAFMPPEAFKGRFSEKSDKFSFAVLTYEVVSLEMPHAGKSIAEITKLAMESFTVSKALEKRGVTAAEQEQEWLEENPFKDRRPDLSLVSPGCPPSLLDWTMKSWSDNPDKRPTFKEGVEFLDNLLEGRPYWGEGGAGERIILPEGTEKEAVVASFRNTLLANQNVAIIKVERVQNPTLWSSYSAKRQTMLHSPGATDSYERTWLFHGTGEDKVLKIIKQGFNRSFGFKEVNENALTMYGKGVYFAVNSSYSSSHRYSKPNGAGEQHMFACRVLVGEYCQGRQDQPTPDVRKGTDLYDSTVDDVKKPEIFVTYHDAQAYPEYLVKFKLQ